MSYKAELEKRYAEIKARMHGKSRQVVDHEATKLAREALWKKHREDEMENFLKALGAVKPPNAHGGVAGSTGVVIAYPTELSDVKPTPNAKENYISMLRFVARKHGIPEELIQSEVRARPIVAARHELWWRVRTELKYSYMRIAMLAERDHSTIIHAVEKFADKALDRGEAQVQSG